MNAVSKGDLFGVGQDQTQLGGGDVDAVTNQAKRVRGPSHRPIPTDFHLHAGREGDLRLKARYGVGRPVILRWRAATGIYCGQPRGPRKPKRRTVASSTATRPKPYKRPVMSEKLSWYDGEDDIGSLHDICFDRSLREEW